MSGRKADEFVSKISGADEKEAQLIMAKATGHFKHGNERQTNVETLEIFAR